MTLCKLWNVFSVKRDKETERICSRWR